MYVTSPLLSCERDDLHSCSGMLFLFFVFAFASSAEIVDMTAMNMSARKEARRADGFWASC